MAQSTVKLIVDAQNAIAPLKRVNEQTKALSSSTDKLKGRLDRSNRSLKNTGRAAKTASAGVGTLVGALKPLLAALAVVGTARFIFVKTAELQTQRTALTQLTGDVEDANKIIKQLQAFGNVTPFTSSELIEQSKRLKAFGFETENLVDTVKRLSDVAGATGADLSGISTAFGQILAKGKLQREEELQLLERGVDITSELKRITKLQGDEFDSAMRKGKIGADLVNQALINLTSEGGVFFGGATAQSKTLNGQVSTLQDNIETLARIIGEQLEPALMSSLKTANKLLGSINRLFSSEFQRQISGFRANLLVPSGTLGDLKKIEDFTKNIQPLGLDVSALDLRIDQLRGTKTQIDTVMNQIGGRVSLKEINQSLNTQKALTKKINELIERKNLLLGIGNKTNKDSKNTQDETITETSTQITLADLFNSKLEKSNFLVNNIKSEADQLKEKFMEIGQGIEQGIVSNLTDAVMGTQTLAQAAVNVLNQLKRKLVEVAIQRAVSGIGNFIGGALGGIFGGGGGILGKTAVGTSSQFVGRASAAAFRANGGPVSAGGAFVVGEKGPELLQMGSRGGNIIPNNQLGGSTTNIVNVSVDASGSTVSGNTPDAQQLGNLIGAAIQERLIKEKRSGGLLSR